MNRGRHKKSNKEKELYIQNEILRNIEKEIHILLKLYKSIRFKFGDNFKIFKYKA